MLPGMDGLEALEQLKKSQSLVNIPVMMVSALAESKKIEKAKSLGAVDYITKPFEPSVLVERIRRVMGGGTPA